MEVAVIVTLVLVFDAIVLVSAAIILRRRSARRRARDQLSGERSA